MSDRRPALVDLPHALREFVSDLPVAYRRWRDDLREDPTLIWRTPLVRIGIWIALGVVLFFCLRGLIGWITPAGADPRFVEPTRLATLYVACTAPACRKAATAQVAMDFNQWPLVCQTCSAKAVYRARLCPACRNWFATAPGQSPECPRCAEAAAAAARRDKPDDAPRDADDEEDDW